MKSYLVTAALPYANGPLHLGHIAGAYLPADIFVRFKRLKGDDVVFICGTDEHGVPITIKAEQQGKTPQALVDEFYAEIKRGFDGLKIDFSIFSRTSNPTHHQTAAAFFTDLHSQGCFVEQETEQFYDEANDQFLADRYITGTCPKCSYEKAYGDQCENCGSSLNPSDLIDPKSAITGVTPTRKKTSHWYLPLDRYQSVLETYILDEHSHWKKNVLGQCKSWLEQGLQPRAVTRDLKWGVEVPLDDADGKVLYVWFDAPIGYISMTKEWAEQQGDPEKWRHYWQRPETDLIHFIGKDNIVFHTIIFPAMLHAHSESYNLPANVPANEFLNLEGGKLSTSRNYAVWVNEYLERFEADSLRFYLTSIMPEQKDSDFSWKQFQQTHNTELADTIGNLINRAFTFIHKYTDGKVPELTLQNDLDEAAMQRIHAVFGEVEFHLERFENKKALEVIMDYARFGNKYFNDQAPWKSRKEHPAQCHATLHISVQLIAQLAVLLNPIMPGFSQRLWVLLGLSESPQQHGWKVVDVPVGQRLSESEIIFQKLEDDQIQPEIDRLQDIVSESNSATESEMTQDPIKSQILLDTFADVDLRVGTISAAEPVPKTEKLLKLHIDLGFEQRQVVSGIATHYKPDDLIGKQVVLIANLKPVKLRGVESQGMILAAEDRDGKLSLVTLDQTLANGISIR